MRDMGSVPVGSWQHDGDAFLMRKKDQLSCERAFCYNGRN